MKQVILILISLTLATVSYGQLNVFSEGDVVSAEEMNENFQQLEQQFRGTRTTTVNCAAGEKIGDAIDNGYTNITVSGTCAENLQFSMWREDSAENSTPTGQLAPRFLRIAGADSSAKIVDTSSNTESTVSVTDGATLLLEDITISGGQYAVNAQHNTNLYLSGVTVENFTEKGIRVGDSALLGIDDDGATIIGTENSTGIELVTGASGWIYSVNISNVDRGLGVYGGSMIYLDSFQISAVSQGISVGNSHVLNSGDGSASIEGTNDRAVSVSHGVFTNWEGILEIKNLKGGQGINFWMSQGNIRNLKMIDFDITASGDSAIDIRDGSSVTFDGVEISGSTADNLISVADLSFLKVRDSILEINNGETAIHSWGSSRLRIDNVTIKGSVTDGLVEIGSGSSVEIRDSVINVTSGEAAVRVYKTSEISLKNSTITGTVTDNLVTINQGSSAEIRDSNITVSTAKKGLVVWENSHLSARNLTISGTTENYLIGIETGANAQFGDSDIMPTSNNTGLYIADGAKLNLRDSNLSGSAPNDLVRITRASNVMIEGNSTVSQTNAGSADISVSYLSLLNVDNVEAPINSVNCYNKGYVGASDGTVTTLPESCTQ